MKRKDHELREREGREVGREVLTFSCSAELLQGSAQLVNVGLVPSQTLQETPTTSHTHNITHSPS